MNNVELYSYLFSYCTEHWITVDIDDRSFKLKYIPLSLKEKISLNNKYSHLEDKTTLLKEQCRRMLSKAYGDVTLADNFTSAQLVTLYYEIVEDLNNFREEFIEFYDKHHTEPLKKDNKKKGNELDSLLVLTNLSKELSIPISELAEMDEVTIFVLMSYLSESSTRESNFFEEKQGGKK